jgi:uncharacterized protein YbjQ (UPF0145 family)
MKITTQHQFSDYEIIETVGLVTGSIALTRHIGSHLLAGIQEIFGGEVSSYTTLLEDARKEALIRLTNAAQEKKANGIVGVGITTSNITDGIIEVLAYGAAVIIQKK